MDKGIKKDVRDISTIELFDKNPRAINKEDFESLKKHLSEFPQFKPILINQDGIILGGNMRYRAYTEMGVNEVWVEEVHTKDMEEIIKYNLIDNQRYGYYQEEATAELIYPYKDKIWKDFKLDFEMPKYDLDSFNKDQFEENELLEEKEEDIKPFEKVHILLSFAPEKLMEIEPFLNKIIQIEGIEYEQSAN